MLPVETYTFLFLVPPFPDSCVLEVDSMVEVIDGVDHVGDLGIVGGPVRGVIKWIGQLPGRKVWQTSFLNDDDFFIFILLSFIFPS